MMVVIDDSFVHFRGYFVVFLPLFGDCIMLLLDAFRNKIS